MDGVTVSSMFTLVSQMLTSATTILEWALTTFPINLGIASGIAGLVIGLVRKSKNVAR